jgi:6-phosphogluconate dehydrogenase (decarboxylating)
MRRSGIWVFGGVGSFLNYSRMRIPFLRHEDFADELLSAMRYEFGGHIEKPAAK